MRNDARPIGEGAHDKSPLDERESVTHDRQSHIVNRDADENASRVNPGEEENVRGVNGRAEEDASTLNTKI
jgi:hypothetical protein